MKNSILLEITNFCECCPSHECCSEEECVLFRIEKLLEEKRDKMSVFNIYDEIKNKYKNVSFADLHMIDVVKKDIDGSDLNFDEVYGLCHDVWIKDGTGLSISLIVDYITEYYDEVKELDLYDIIDRINEV